MSERWIVDRIEDDVAVLECEGSFVDWPLERLPPGTREGDRLRIDIRLEAPVPHRPRNLKSGPSGGDIDL